MAAYRLPEAFDRVLGAMDRTGLDPHPRLSFCDELAQFGTAFDAGMDPLEVGEKTLAGMLENRAVIFTHPEF